MREDNQGAQISVTIRGFVPRTFRGRPIAYADLVIGAGEVAVVFGRNGSGKTTLAQAICSACRSSDGPDADSAGVTISPRLGFAHGGVLYLPEEPELALTSQTVLEEVSFSIRHSLLSERQGREWLEAIIEQFCLGEILHRRLATLSGGQRQRILIASLIAARPRLLLTDDYTTNLDPYQARFVNDAITEMVRTEGASWLELTRRLGFIDPSSQQLLIVDGRLERPSQRNALAFDSSGGFDENIQNDVNPTEAELLGKVLRRPEGDEGNLALESVEFQYPESGFSLEIPSLDLKPGITFLLGPNGCGKTTAAKLLCGILAPGHGRITENGIACRLDDLRNRTAMVLQQPRHHFLRRTIREDIEHALNAGESPSSRSSFEQLLRTLKIDADLDRDAATLSQSWQRRVAIALAFAKRHVLTCLDEPTLGQDTLGVHLLARLFQFLADAGRHLLIVTHDLEFVSLLRGRCLLMKEGRIIAETPSEVVRDQVAAGQMPICYRQTH